MGSHRRVILLSSLENISPSFLGLFPQGTCLSLVRDTGAISWLSLSAFAFVSFVRIKRISLSLRVVFSLAALSFSHGSLAVALRVVFVCSIWRRFQSNSQSEEKIL